MAEQLADGLDHRRGPRRRGVELYRAVFHAVLTELAQSGYGALTVDAVARRARVSKATLYRRWPSKRDLVLAAVQASVPDPDHLPDTGTLRGDLIAFLTQVAAHLHGPTGSAVRGILSDILGDPGSAAELYGAAHRHRSVEQVRSLLARAAERGEVPASVLDGLPALRLEAGPAILRQHYLWEGTVTHDLCVGIVDDVMVPLLTLQPPSGSSSARGEASWDTR